MRNKENEIGFLIIIGLTILNAHCERLHSGGPELYLAASIAKHPSAKEIFRSFVGTLRISLALSSPFVIYRYHTYEPRTSLEKRLKTVHRLFKYE